MLIGTRHASTQEELNCYVLKFNGFIAENSYEKKTGRLLPN